MCLKTTEKSKKSLRGQIVFVPSKLTLLCVKAYIYLFFDIFFKFSNIGCIY